MKKKYLGALFAMFLAFGVSSTAHALSTIIKLDLGGVGPDVTYDGSTFHTINQTPGATPVGDQLTNVDYLSFLSFLPAISTDNASFSLTGVTATGGATNIGGVTAQNTTGGTFALYDSTNSLLLSGVLSDGQISVASLAQTGSFFNTSIASFTGGSLLSYVANTPASLSLSLLNVTSILNTDRIPTSGLSAFTADATGLVGGTPVPEPATAFLLLGALPGFFGIRRRR